MKGFQIQPVFSFFFRKELRSKRTRIFLVISFIPFLILFTVQIIKWVSPDFSIFLYKIFNMGIIPFYFTMFIQFISLFFASSIISDEWENNTLIYLTTTPTPRSSIMIGKFLAALCTGLTIILSSFSLSFLLSYHRQLSTTNLQLFAGLIITAVLSLLIYSSFFCLLGTLFKRSLMWGILFILGWENFIQFLPGSTQKFSFNHYVKSLLPVELPSKGGFLTFNLSPSSHSESVTVIFSLSLLFLALSIILFSFKEYQISSGD